MLLTARKTALYDVLFALTPYYDLAPSVKPPAEPRSENSDKPYAEATLMQPRSSLHANGSGPDPHSRKMSRTYQQGALRAWSSCPRRSPRP